MTNIRGVRWIVGAAISLIALALAAGPALAEKRVALVIGNSAYRHVAGPNSAANGARVIAAALQNVGFTLSGGAALFDLDKSSLDRAIQEFGRQIGDADVALIYYAGHAVQLRGSDFLVPVDANPTKEADVDNQMLHIGLLLHQFDGSAQRLNLVVLDACHNNPFIGRGLNGLEAGLAPLHVPDATLVSYAAQPDTVVPDNADGNNLFALTLAQALRKPDLDILGVFNDLGSTVKRLTNGAQQPFVSFTPIGRFTLAATPSPSTDKHPFGFSPTKPEFPNPTNNTATDRHERAVLYDQDPNDANGRQYKGTVVWRIEPIKTSGGRKADVALRADIEIPERSLKLTISLRRNDDPTLPASHTVELKFAVPPDFSDGGIAKVPGVLMKTDEQTRGAPLSGISVTVKDSFFLVGLSNGESDKARNMQLLAERQWLDIPLVYSNQHRAMLAIAKGPTGDQSFASALSAWSDQK